MLLRAEQFGNGLDHQQVLVGHGLHLGVEGDATGHLLRVVDVDCGEMITSVNNNNNNQGELTSFLVLEMSETRLDAFGCLVESFLRDILQSDRGELARRGTRLCDACGETTEVSNVDKVVNMEHYSPDPIRPEPRMSTFSMRDTGTVW